MQEDQKKMHVYKKKFVSTQMEANDYHCIPCTFLDFDANGLGTKQQSFYEGSVWGEG